MTAIAALIIFTIVLGLVGYFAMRFGIRLFDKYYPRRNQFGHKGNATMMIDKLQHSITKRVLAIAVLGLAMSIPLAIVEGVVDDRGRYYRQVTGEIANLWGHQKIVRGPMLVIPFIEKYVSEEAVENDDGETETRSKTHFQRRHAIILPDKLSLSADVTDRYRTRAIYRSLVYSAELSLEAEFPQPNIDQLSHRLHKVEWDKAWIAIGLSDTKSIDSVSQLSWNGVAQNLAAGTGITDLVKSGFHAPLNNLQPDVDDYQLDLTVNVNGSRGIRFAPLGETTNATIQSTWPHPSFAGNLLPDERTITDEGFTANWEIPHLARNYPQRWVLDHEAVDLDELLAGVDLFEPVVIYSRITRAVKYGLLIVGLTFLTFLVFELVSGTALHIVQYTLIGAALALFYLLVLSLAEHLGFAIAYVSATSLSVGMISIYVAAASQSRGRGLFLFSLLSTMYGLLYALLQMEDYALLAGTVVLFAVLVVLMFLTRGLRVEEKRTGGKTISEEIL